MDQNNLSSKKVYRASQTLNLGERAGLEDIKNKYRKLIKKWHPDKCEEEPEECKKKTEEIVWAYKIIISYCNNYLYSFKEDDIINSLPVDIQMKDMWKKRFQDDPLWN